MYNRWSNDETGLVAMWLGNDQSLYDMVREKAGDARDADGDPVDILARDLETVITQGSPSQNGLYADIIAATLAKVDWYELAQDYIEEE